MTWIKVVPACLRQQCYFLACNVFRATSGSDHFSSSGRYVKASALE